MFERNPQQQKLYDEAVAFGQTLNDAPGVATVLERDARGEFSLPLWRHCAAAGVLGLFVDTDHGGRGLTIADSVAYLEGLGYGCHDNGFTYGLNAQLWSVVDALVRVATDEQKQRYLVPLVKGDAIGCFAMTEPDTGSDCFALTTVAEKIDGGYRLTGTKQLVTFAPVADFALVFARIKSTPDAQPEPGRWGISCFLVDADSAGYLRSGIQSKMGLRTTPIGEIQLDGCVVAQDALLGNEGSGASLFSMSQEVERGCILSSQLGAMARQLERAVGHARERRQFGQNIGKFQSVSNRIVDMRLRVETGRMMLQKSAHLISSGKPSMLEAAMTNLLIAEAGLESSIDAVRIHGGRGFLTEFEVERDMRDAMGSPLYGGTSDIQRDIIARLLGI